MLKNKLNYRLINITLICVIIYLIYKSRNLWLIIFRTINKIILPFIFAFFIAYIFYPILNYLKSKKIPKAIGILLIIGSILGIIILTSILLFPTMFDQIVSLINYIITFIKQISLKYHLNLGDFEKYLYEIIMYLGEYLSYSAMTIINNSINYVMQTIVISTLSIYFLNDMDKIRNFFKKIFFKDNYRNFDCIKEIDSELHKYFFAFFKIMIISFFEYSIIYTIIGHPNAIILGILVAILGIIPYIGGIITNIIAGITAFAIGPDLFIKTLISFFILSIIDGYVINPIVYGKSNKIHPLIIIFSCLAGGILGGILGMITALPITIVCLTIIKFYKTDLFVLKYKIKHVNLK